MATNSRRRARAARKLRARLGHERGSPVPATPDTPAVRPGAKYPQDEMPAAADPHPELEPMPQPIAPDPEPQKWILPPDFDQRPQPEPDPEPPQSAPEPPAVAPEPPPRAARVEEWRGPDGIGPSNPVPLADAHDPKTGRRRVRIPMPDGSTIEGFIGTGSFMDEEF